jgi:pyroglutamyl-peptidase
MRIAVSGFGPFGSDTYNPTAAVVDQLVKRDASLAAQVFEVSREVVDGELPQWLEREHPDVLLSLGLAGGRTAMAIEAVAVNLVRFAIPDTRGHHPQAGAIVDEGPAAYLSGLGTDQVVSLWRTAQVPGYTSFSAGTYLCNYLFYRASHWMSERGGGRAAFVHVPYSTVWVPNPAQHPSMEESRMVEGIEVLVRALRAGEL